MKYIYRTAAAALIFIIFLSGCNSYNQKASSDLSTKQDSLSYSFGYLQGKSLSNEGISDVNMPNYLAGFHTGLDTSATSEIDNNAMQVLVQTYLQELEMKRQDEREAEAAVNVERGKAFLEENKNNSDVHETESGLQYRVLKEGTGVSPGEDDTVKVHYEGRLLTDEVFDSSYDRGNPVSFPLNRVIEGWTEGLQLMKEGAKYQFFIPADLAYGNNPPQGSPIPPGAVLIFDVELLEVNPAN